MVINWRVVTEYETLSDHLHRGGPQRYPPRTRTECRGRPRDGLAVSRGRRTGNSRKGELVRDALRDAYDFAMPRTNPRPRRAAYWWSGEIAELWHRTAEAYEGFRTARNALSAAIRETKAGAWNELLRSLDADPWGRTYRLVMNELKSWRPL
ncbi:hypothetical protein ACFW04_011858 [Cataglyphis niger]